MTARRFWLQHALVPAALFGAALALVGSLGLDLRLADALYDPAAGGFPLRYAFWTETVLHKGGVKLPAAVALTALIALLAGFRISRWRRYRRAAAYVLLCFALGPGLVALGKRFSATDCPWSLQRYGGSKPYLEWGDPRPESLAPGHCYPGGHSSGAFAFFAFYFLLRGTRPRAARAALVGTLALGLVFAGTQWLRGAHFISHDLASAWLGWNVGLLLYALLYRAALAQEFRAANGPDGRREAPSRAPSR